MRRALVTGTASVRVQHAASASKAVTRAHERGGGIGKGGRASTNILDLETDGVARVLQPGRRAGSQTS